MTRTVFLVVRQIRIPAAALDWLLLLRPARS